MSREVENWGSITLIEGYWMIKPWNHDFPLFHDKAASGPMPFFCHFMQQQPNSVLCQLREDVYSISQVPQLSNKFALMLQRLEKHSAHAWMFYWVYIRSILNVVCLLLPLAQAEAIAWDSSSCLEAQTFSLSQNVLLSILERRAPLAKLLHPYHIHPVAVDKHLIFVLIE